MVNHTGLGGIVFRMSDSHQVEVSGNESAAPRVISVADHGVLPDGSDCTQGLKEALRDCRAQAARRLVFPQGRYDFWPDAADEAYLYVSNNDEGLKRIVFILKGFDELTIDGQGSEFVFHGFLSPFLIQESARIRLENFSIDFSRSFHSEGQILGVHDEGMDVRIPPQFPYEVRNGLLTFVAGNREELPLTTVSNGGVFGSGHLLEFDTEKRETAYMAEDYFFKGTSVYPAKDLGKGVVRLCIPGLSGTPGNTMVFGPNHREHPGFVVTHSSDVSLENVTIYHAGGMGILGQLSHNIVVNNCRVTPSGGRMLSTTADATHFVNCTGYIKLTNNLFENQKDDATNIHGTYVKVSRILGPDEILVQLMHQQQHGLEFLDTGVQVEFVRGKSMITFAEAVVEKVVRLNKELTKVIFANGLPDGLVPGDAIAAVGDYPVVTIANNHIRNNRARGMLLNCRGKTVVENNYFHTPGAAILFEGDAFFWFEQGGVRDCVIRNNTFDNCLFGVWGKAVIDVDSGIREDREISRYNRNIRIEDNTFRMFDDLSLMHAYCVDGLTWRNNTVEKTDAYPPKNQSFKRFDISYCDHVSIDDETLLTPDA